MPRHKKEVELKKWIAQNTVSIFHVEFYIKSLNKDVCVVSEHYSAGEIILSKKYPAATKITLKKNYEHPLS